MIRDRRCRQEVSPWSPGRRRRWLRPPSRSKFCRLWSERSRLRTCRCETNTRHTSLTIVGPSRTRTQLLHVFSHSDRAGELLFWNVYRYFLLQLPFISHMDIINKVSLVIIKHDVGEHRKHLWTALTDWSSGSFSTVTVLINWDQYVIGFMLWWHHRSSLVLTTACLIDFRFII